MSFLDSLGSLAKSAGGFLSSGSIGSSLAKTALLGFALNRMQSSMNKKTDAGKDKGREIQLNPSTENAIPVVYGDAYVKGMVTDAYLASDNKTMWFCLTVSEKTGTLLSTSAASAISFREVYLDGLRLSFQADGVTVENAYDEDGVSTDKWNGLIKIYPFNNGSANPTTFTTETTGNSSTAYSLFPNWASTNSMSNLVFALVLITYNSEKDLTSLGEMTFKLSNTMRQPGDCLYDYATNNRYGAGIDSTEIYQ
jgi:hypothetical protein